MIRIPNIEPLSVFSREDELRFSVASLYHPPSSPSWPFATEVMVLMQGSATGWYQIVAAAETHAAAWSFGSSAALVSSVSVPGVVNESIWVIYYLVLRRGSVSVYSGLISRPQRLSDPVVSQLKRSSW